MLDPKTLSEWNELSSHLVVSGKDNRIYGFNYLGGLLFESKALTQGIGGHFRNRSGDTPPGLYKIGQVYKDYEIHGENPPNNRDVRAYGWYSFDLIELENQESRYNRAGIMIHGGGSNLGFPGCWEARQELLPTLGCVRIFNELGITISKLCFKSTVFVTVTQPYD